MATVVSMRMNCIQRTITNTYNMGYVLDLTCQEWWVPWGCKNLGESNFHMENGVQEAQKLPIGINISPGLRGTCQNFFSFTIGVVGGTFLEVTLRLPKRG